MSDSSTKCLAGLNRGTIYTAAYRYNLQGTLYSKHSGFRLQPHSKYILIYVLCCLFNKRKKSFKHKMVTFQSESMYR